MNSLVKNLNMCEFLENSIKNNLYFQQFPHYHVYLVGLKFLFLEHFQ